VQSQNDSGNSSLADRSLLIVVPSLVGAVCCISRDIGLG